MRDPTALQTSVSQREIRRDGVLRAAGNAGVAQVVTLQTLHVVEERLAFLEAGFERLGVAVASVAERCMETVGSVLNA